MTAGNCEMACADRKGIARYRFTGNSLLVSYADWRVLMLGRKSLTGVFHGVADTRVKLLISGYSGLWIVL